MIRTRPFHALLEYSASSLRDFFYLRYNACFSQLASTKYFFLSSTVRLPHLPPQRYTTFDARSSGFREEVCNLQQPSSFINCQISFRNRHLKKAVKYFESHAACKERHAYIQYSITTFRKARCSLGTLPSHLQFTDFISTHRFFLKTYSSLRVALDTHRN